MGKVINIQPSGDICRVTQKMNLIGTYSPETKFINLTPHVLNVHTNEAGQVELYSVQYGEVTGLPPEEEGVVYVTSGMVNAAVVDRTDVTSPGDLLRDEGGKPIGCKGLRK